MNARPAAEPRAGRRRPLWLVGALSALSLGAYIPIWFGLTWAELRREDGDARKDPVAHALSVFIPGFNAWQAYRHFRAIGDLAERSGGGVRVDATTAALGVIIWWVTFTHYASDPIFLVLDAIELVAGTAVVVYGQRALNPLWAARGAEERILDTDWLALAIAGTYALLTVLMFLSAPA